MGEPLQLGRYSLVVELASGGMATVHLGRMSGAAGFGRIVAIKRLHPHLARDPKFVSSFVDEARLVARVHHPNVVPVLDVVVQDGEVFLVLEYVQGESLGGLLRASGQAEKRIPVPISLAVILGALNGLHAAHEARDEQGQALQIVHRDVSPQNIIVGVDGVARVLDFGIAKAVKRLLETTREGRLKGKIPYMAPEHILSAATRQSDVYAAGVVLWEMLAGRRMFAIKNELELFQAVLTAEVPLPSAVNPAVPPEVDRIVARAIARSPKERFATAREMAEAVDACIDVASSMKVAQWVESTAGPGLEKRRELVAQVERTNSVPILEEPQEDETIRMVGLFPAPADVTAPVPVITAPVPAASAFGATLKMSASDMAQATRHALVTTPSPREAYAPPARPLTLAATRWYGRVALLGVSVLIIGWLGVMRSCHHAPEQTEAAASAQDVAPSPSGTPSRTEDETAISVPVESLPAAAPTAPTVTARTETRTETKAPPMPRPTPSGGSVADRVRHIMLDDPDGAKKLLKPRVDGGRATREEIVLYKTICKDQHDAVCLNQAKTLLGEK